MKKIFRESAAIFLITVAILLYVEGICFVLRKAGVPNPLVYKWTSGNQDTKAPFPYKHSIPSGFSSRPMVNANPSKNPHPPSPKLNFSGKDLYRIADGLTVPEAGEYKVSAISNLDGKMIYDIAYQIDSHGYRETPKIPNATKFSVFLGDSFTFGVGVESDETLPIQFHRRLPSFQPYNFGFLGYGTNDLLLRTMRENVQDIVKEKSGLILYIYNSSQISRFLGQATYAGFWGAHRPYFYKTANDEIAYGGSFAEAVPFWRFFSWAVFNTNFVRYFDLDWPVKITPPQAHFFALAVKKLKNHYLSKLPGGRFILVISPGEKIFTKEILAELDKNEIDFIDYSDVDLPFYVWGQTKIPGDGHNTAEATSVFADQLAKDLKVFL